LLLKPPDAHAGQRLRSAAMPVPPLALERHFFFLDLPETGPRSRLSNNEVLALVDAHRTANWVVLRSRGAGTAEFRACSVADLRFVLATRKPEGSFTTTLRFAAIARVVGIDWQRYKHTTAHPALVYDDSLLVGVAVPRPGGTRSGAGAPGGQGWDDAAFVVAAAPEAAAMAELKSDGDDESIEWPHRLDAQLPGQVSVGQHVTLRVSLERLHAPAAHDPETIALRMGEPLQILAQGDALLQAADSASQELAVAPEGQEAAVCFEFKALAAGRSRVKVFALRGAQTVARLVLPVQVVSHVLPATAPAQAGDRRWLAAAGSSSRSDLSLLVLESECDLRFQLWARGTKQADFEPVRARQLAQYARRFVESIDGLTLKDSASSERARLKLRAWGSTLFRDLIPAALQDLLVAQQRDITVQVCSDEAWIPWEVCCLQSYAADGSVSEGPFFAEAFAMTRWLHGVPAPGRLRMSNCALVVPGGSGLAAAARERAHYRGLGAGSRTVSDIPPLYGKVSAALASGRFEAWHFCGHAHGGRANDGDEASLEFDDDVMRADEFAGTVENALLPRPLIFLNACQSAIGGQAATGVGGWAQRFIRPSRGRHGAAAFLGTYWSVYDEAAQRFAEAFYDALWQHRPIGVAAREARAEVRRWGESNGDPLSWLAYTVYADPLATLEVS